MVAESSIFSSIPFNYNGTTYAVRKEIDQILARTKVPW